MNGFTHIYDFSYVFKVLAELDPKLGTDPERYWAKRERQDSHLA